MAAHRFADQVSQLPFNIRRQKRPLFERKQNSSERKQKPFEMVTLLRFLADVVLNLTRLQVDVHDSDNSKVKFRIKRRTSLLVVGTY